jgi:hypothetical protein
MTSITQNHTETQPLDLTPDFNPLTQGGYEEWRADVYGALLDAGMADEADKWWACARGNAVWFPSTDTPVGDDTKAVYVCPDHPGHHAKAQRITCQLRVCPECAKRESARLLARYMPVVKELAHRHHPKYRFRKIVLTTPLDVRDKDARQKLLHYFKCVPMMFDRLLPKGWRKEQGFLPAYEFGTHGLKLHFHIIFYGQWLDNRKANGYPLASAWEAVTGGECEVVRIYGIKPDDVEDEIVENLKYCTKFWKLDADGKPERLDPELVPVLLTVLKGTRRIRSYGLFYKIGKPVKEPMRCPACDAILVRWSATEWNIFAETGWLPDQAREHLGSDIANKSPPTTGKNNKRGSPATSESDVLQPNIPGLVDNQTDKNVSHYQ